MSHGLYEPYVIDRSIISAGMKPTILGPLTTRPWAAQGMRRLQQLFWPGSVQSQDWPGATLPGFWDQMRLEMFCFSNLMLYWRPLLMDWDLKKKGDSLKDLWEVGLFSQRPQFFLWPLMSIPLHLHWYFNSSGLPLVKVQYHFCGKVTDYWFPLLTCLILKIVLKKGTELSLARNPWKKTDQVSEVVFSPNL